MRLPALLAGPLASLASRLGRQNAFAPARIPTSNPRPPMSIPRIPRFLRLARRAALAAALAALCAGCAEPPSVGSFSVPNRLRLSGTDVPLGATNELAFAVEKGRLPCEFALDCRRLETGCLTVFCENGQAVFYPSNRIDVVTEGGIETIAAEHPVATLSFGEGVNHEKTLVVDPEGLRRECGPNARTALRCKVAEDEKRYLVTIPIVLSHDCPPTTVTFCILSNWYDY